MNFNEIWLVEFYWNLIGWILMRLPYDSFTISEWFLSVVKGNQPPLLNKKIRKAIWNEKTRSRLRNNFWKNTTLETEHLRCISLCKKCIKTYFKRILTMVLSQIKTFFNKTCHEQNNIKDDKIVSEEKELIGTFNHLCVNLIKWPNTLKHFVGKWPTAILRGWHLKG